LCALFGDAGKWRENIFYRWEWDTVEEQRAETINYSMVIKLGKGTNIGMRCVIRVIRIRRGGKREAQFPTLKTYSRWFVEMIEKTVQSHCTSFHQNNPQLPGRVVRSGKGPDHRSVRGWDPPHKASLHLFWQPLRSTPSVSTSDRVSWTIQLYACRETLAGTNDASPAGPGV